MTARTVIFEQPYSDEERSGLAMTVVLVSFGMLFASLFLMYAVYRNANAVWPPMGFEKLSLKIPLLSTLAIVSSSITMYFAQKYYLLKNIVRFKVYYRATLLLGLLFVLSQFVLWNNLKLSGIYADSGVFGSILYSFTWIHSAHIVLGVFALLLCWKAAKINSAKDYSLRIINAAKFWHFLDIVWILMLLLLFVF